MSITTARLRYTQFFLACLLVAALGIMAQSLAYGAAYNFGDAMWGRKLLIESFTRLRLKLGDHVFLQAVMGKQGWMEMTGNLDGYQNAIQLTPLELVQMQNEVQTLYDELQKRNITFILIIAPDKATIYPDKLPDQLQKLQPHSKLDEFAAYLQTHGPPVLVDLRPALWQARKQNDLYYKTDTHWNLYGAFIGYTQIMQALSKTYPQLAPTSIQDYKIKILEPMLHDLPKAIGATQILEPEINIIPKKNDNPVTWLVLNNDRIPMSVSMTQHSNMPTLLMYMDSFGIGLRPFLAPNFSKATFIMHSSVYPDAVSLKTIDAIKPDVLIIELVERGFSGLSLRTLLGKFIPQ